MTDPHPQGIFDGSRIQVTPTSLTIVDPDLPYEAFEELCERIGDIGIAQAWWSGDALNQGEGLYGERVAQASEKLRLSPQTIMNRMSICKHVPKSRRRPDLSFSAHAEVAYLPPAQQKDLLLKASRQRLTKVEIREEVRSLKAGENGPLPPAVEVVCVCPACGKEHNPL